MIFEIRILPRQGGRIYSGYFDSVEAAQKAISSFDSSTETAGIYCTLNEINPACAARAPNIIQFAAQTTSDADIIRRRWLPIDFDPVRPAGVSSTEEEHQAALDRARHVRDWLRERGFGNPTLADSGNGAHLLYPIDLPPDDGGLVRQVLAVLDAVFSDDKVKIDTAVHNPARIWRFYGTMTRKGSNTPDRPWRRSQVLEGCGQREPVPEETLRQIAALIPSSPVPAAVRLPGFDLHTWLAEHGIAVRSQKPWQGGTLFVLAECPFSSAHKDGAYAIQFPNGAVFAGCHHNSCGGGSQRWQELRQRYEPAATTTTPAAGEGIEITGDLAEMVKRAVAILRRHPALFIYAGDIVQVHLDEQGNVYLKNINVDRLRHILSEMTVWHKPGRNDPHPPPEMVCRAILAMPPQEWKLRPVTGLASIPVYRPDGSLCAVTGYDPTLRRYLCLDTTPDIPTEPAPHDVEAAILVIDEIIGDFPFAGEADRANTIAAMLTPIARHISGGLVPAWLCDKPQPRTGASLLQTVVAEIITGAPAAQKTMPENDDEFRKYITATLAGGKEIVIFDNIENRVRATSLHTLLTAQVWEDRRLGTSQTVRYENRLIVFLNGNNVQLSPDMAPRCYLTRLDARTARPGERKGFRHPNLIQYVRQHRHTILSALYTIVQAWVSAGMPPAPDPPILGMFQEWVNVIAGILHHAGIRGFMLNQEVLYQKSDPETGQWDAFFMYLYERFGDEPFTATRIHEILTQDPDAPAPDEIGGGSGGNPVSIRGAVTIIGRALSKRRDRVYPCGLCIREAGLEKGTNRQQHRLERVCGQMELGGRNGVQLSKSEI